MPWGVHYFESPPAKITAHVEDIATSIHENNASRISTIISNWTSDDSIHNPEPNDLKLVLAEAAKTNNVAAAEVLLQAGAQISPVAANAASSKEMFECFLAHGWDINMPTSAGLSAVQRHVSDVELLRWLLGHGADLTVVSRETGLTLLDIASTVAPLESVKMALEAGADVRKSSALQSAARSYADSDPADEEDDEADFVPAEDLHEADDYRDRVPVMQLLLKHGADIHAIDRMHAGQEIVKKLLQPTRGGFEPVLGTALHEAVRVGAVARVKLLVAHGADVAAKDTAGETVTELAERLKTRNECLLLLKSVAADQSI